MSICYQTWIKKVLNKRKYYQLTELSSDGTIIKKKFQNGINRRYKFITDDWTNENVFVYDFRKNTSTTHTISDNTRGTADLYYNKSSELIYIPIPNSSSLIIIKWSNLIPKN